MSSPDPDSGKPTHYEAQIRDHVPEIDDNPSLQRTAKSLPLSFSLCFYVDDGNFRLISYQRFLNPQFQLYVLNESVLRIKVAYFDGKHYKSDDIQIITKNCAAGRYNFICLRHQNISEGLILTGNN
jgi:hypothetical protein